MPTPYWAGVPVGTRQEMPTEINVKALMFENSDDKVTHWVTDPSQDNSSVGDDIIITYSFVEDSSSKFLADGVPAELPNLPFGL